MLLPAIICHPGPCCCPWIIQTPRWCAAARTTAMLGEWAVARWAQVQSPHLGYPGPKARLGILSNSPVLALVPMFSSRCFMVSSLTFRSLIHFFSFLPYFSNFFKVFNPFWVYLVYGVRTWSSFIFWHLSVQFSQHSLLNRLPLPHCMFLTPLSYINWPYKHGFISGLCILFHWSMCLFLC